METEIKTIFTGNKIRFETGKVQTSILLTRIGAKGRDIFFRLNFENDEDKKNFKKSNWEIWQM